MARADRQRWLALGLLLAVLALAYLVLVHPWWTVPMRELGTQFQQSRERQLRVRTTMAQAPEVEKQLAHARELLDTRPGFIPEPTPERASAALVQRLEAVVRQASPGNRGCVIGNRVPLPAAGDGDGRFPKVTVRVSLHCGMAETVAVLHELESGKPRLFVERLDILSRAGSYLQDDPNAHAGGLGVDFDLHGYLGPVASATEAGDGR